MGQVKRVAILRRRNPLIMLESFHKVFIVTEADLKGNLLDRFGGMVQERFGRAEPGRPAACSAGVHSSQGWHYFQRYQREGAQRQAAPT